MLLTMTPFTTDWEEDVDPAEARALQPIMIERSPAHTDAENNLLFIICIYPFLLFPVCFWIFYTTIVTTIVPDFSDDSAWWWCHLAGSWQYIAHSWWYLADSWQYITHSWWYLTDSWCTVLIHNGADRFGFCQIQMQTNLYRLFFLYHKSRGKKWKWHEKNMRREWKCKEITAKTYLLCIVRLCYNPYGNLRCLCHVGNWWKRTVEVSSLYIFI